MSADGPVNSFGRDDLFTVYWLYFGMFCIFSSNFSLQLGSARSHSILYACSIFITDPIITFLGFCMGGSFAQSMGSFAQIFRLLIPWWLFQSILTQRILGNILVVWNSQRPPAAECLCVVPFPSVAYYLVSLFPIFSPARDWVKATQYLLSSFPSVLLFGLTVPYCLLLINSPLNWWAGYFQG